MYRKYYSYSDMPRLAKKSEKEVLPVKSEPVCCEQKPDSGGKLFGRFESDDVLLAVIIIMLLADDGADSTLIIALAAVFLSGLI